MNPLLAQTGASDFFGRNAAKGEAGLDGAKLADAIQKGSYV